MGATHAVICIKPITGEADIVKIGSLHECGFAASDLQRASGLGRGSIQYITVAVETSGSLRMYNQTSYASLANYLIPELRKRLTPVAPIVRESTLVVSPSHVPAKTWTEIGLRAK